MVVAVRFVVFFWDLRWCVPVVRGVSHYPIGSSDMGANYIVGWKDANFPHFFRNFPTDIVFYEMEWIWPVREMVGKLVLYILIWRNDIRKSCFQIRI